jgi:hypothetical protein
VQCESEEIEESTVLAGTQPAPFQPTRPFTVPCAEFHGIVSASWSAGAVPFQAVGSPGFVSQKDCKTGDFWAQFTFP